MAKLTQQQYLIKCNDIHGDMYDYTKSIFTNTRGKITITCKTHGDFTQLAGVHIYQKQGCPKCGDMKASKKRRKMKTLSTSENIKTFKKIHGDKYDYSLTKTFRAREFVTIICKKHGEFAQRVSAHKQGQGCPTCARGSGSTSDGDVVYLLRVMGRDIYKVGITSKKLGKQRFKKIGYVSGLKLELLEYVESENAKSIESYILGIGLDAGLVDFSGSSEFRYFTDNELVEVLTALKQK